MVISETAKLVGVIIVGAVISIIVCYIIVALKKFHHDGTGFDYTGEGIGDSFSAGDGTTDYVTYSDVFTSDKDLSVSSKTGYNISINSGVELLLEGTDSVDITSSGTGGFTVNSKSGSLTLDATGQAFVEKCSTSTITATSNVTETISGNYLLSVVNTTAKNESSIVIETNGTVTEKILIENKKGTDDDSVIVKSDAGGIYLDAALGTTAVSGDFLVAGSSSLKSVDIDTTGGTVVIDGTGTVSVDVDGTIILDSAAVSGSAVELHASNAAGGVTINSGTGGFTVSSTGALSLTGTSAAASKINSTNAAGVDFTISSTSGSLILQGGESVADSVQLLGPGVKIETSKDVANAIYLHSNGGTSDTIKVYNQTGTALGSIYLDSLVGGINLNAENSTTGIVTINGANSINIDSGTAGIAIDSTGEINIGANTAAGSINIGTNKTERAITIGSSKDATEVAVITGTGGFSITSGTGNIIIGTDAADHDVSIGSKTGSSKVTIQSGTDGINLLPVATGPINIGTTVVNAITIGNTGNTSLTSIVGGSGGITLTETGGVVTINNTNGAGSATAISLNANTVNEDGVTLKGNTGGVTITNTNGAFTVTTGTAAVSIGEQAAVHTNAIGNILSTSTTLGGILLDFNAGTGGVDIDSTGTVTIDSVGGKINIGVATNSADINIGTNANPRTLTLGTVNGASTTQIYGGTGGLLLTTNSGITERISLINTLGDTADCIRLTSFVGGITLTTAAANNVSVPYGFDVNGTTTLDKTTINTTDGTFSVEGSGSVSIKPEAASATAVSIIPTAGGIKLQSTIDSASAISISTNSGGTSETIKISNAAGTASDAVSLVSTAGGVTISSTKNGADAITLSAITGAGAIGIESGTGGIAIGAGNYAGNIKIGTLGARTVTIGGTSLTGAIINTGTGDITLESKTSGKISLIPIGATNYTSIVGAKFTGKDLAHTDDTALTYLDSGSIYSMNSSGSTLSVSLPTPVIAGLNYKFFIKDCTNVITISGGANLIYGTIFDNTPQVLQISGMSNIICTSAAIGDTIDIFSTPLYWMARAFSSAKGAITKS